nr:hypothetical protein 6 [bacterium]
MMLEKEVERVVCDYAEAYGMLAYKFKSPSKRDVPDRLFVNKGRVFFIEFKRPGEKPRRSQDHEFRKMRLNGAAVYVVDNIRQGKDIIRSEYDWLNAATS